MKKVLTLSFVVMAGVLASCGRAPVCPERSDTASADAVAKAATLHRDVGTPVVMEIDGRSVLVDKVVDGPLCDDSWKGTVYVGCDVHVPAWQGTPSFLRDCNLTIAPGSVVYVAAHNNAAYYNGCSCHTGESTKP